MDKFQLVSEYRPSGDQPEAIEALARGVELGLPEQTLLVRSAASASSLPAPAIPNVRTSPWHR